MIRRIENPPNPFALANIEWLDAVSESTLEVYEEHARSIITENKSPDISFRYSVNPYRGCFHACSYCYARPTHQYLDFGAGTDFERKIVVKANAPQLLEQAFMRKSWEGETIVFSGVTDCYQPLENSYQLTRQCLEMCKRFRNPVAIITKGALVRRDIDVLLPLAELGAASVTMSLAFADDKEAKAFEPNAPRPSVRLRALAELSSAGIPVGIGLAPVIPGINDHQIPEILSRASDAGASWAFMTLLRLPAEVEEVFTTRLAEAAPGRAKKVLNGLRKLKGGQLNRTEFGKRMRGSGERWQAIEWLFKSTCEKLGLNRYDDAGLEHLTKSPFRRPKEQLQLFG